MWEGSIQHPDPHLHPPLFLSFSPHTVLPRPMRRSARRPWDAATHVRQTHSRAQTVAACHRSTSWRKFVSFSSRDVIFKDLTVEVNAFASPDLLKRTELFNAQPCSPFLLAVRCCPSTTHWSSSSSPAEATCRFLFRLLLIAVTGVLDLACACLFQTTVRAITHEETFILKTENWLVAAGVFITIFNKCKILITEQQLF